MPETKKTLKDCFVQNGEAPNKKVCNSSIINLLLLLLVVVVCGGIRSDVWLYLLFI